MTCMFLGASPFNVNEREGHLALGLLSVNWTRVASRTGLAQLGMDASGISLWACSAWTGREWHLKLGLLGVNWTELDASQL